MRRSTRRWRWSGRHWRRDRASLRARAPSSTVFDHGCTHAHPEPDARRQGAPVTRHLLDVTDVDAGEVRQILDMAALPPAALGRPLDGLGAALIFEKASNRTRQSMEMAVFQLGGHPVYTHGSEVGFDTRETVE